MNFVAGFVLVAILFAAVGGYAVPVISGFADGFPYAGEEGLMEGDRILSINGHRIGVYSDVSTQLNAAAGDGSMDLVIQRNGEKIVLEDFPLAPREYTEDGVTVTKYGLYFTMEEATFLGTLSQSWHTCGYFAGRCGPAWGCWSPARWAWGICRARWASSPTWVRRAAKGAALPPGCRMWCISSPSSP